MTRRKVFNPSKNPNHKAPANSGNSNNGPFSPKEKSKRKIDERSPTAKDQDSVAKRLRELKVKGYSGSCTVREPGTKITDHFPKAVDVPATTFNVTAVVHSPGEVNDDVDPAHTSVNAHDIDATENAPNEIIIEQPNHSDTETYASKTKGNDLDLSILSEENKKITLMLVNLIMDTTTDTATKTKLCMEWKESADAHYDLSINTIANHYKTKTNNLNSKIQALKHTPTDLNNKANQSTIKANTNGLKAMKLKQYTQDRTNEMEACGRSSRIYNLKCSAGNNREHLLRDIKNHFNNDISIENSLHNAVVTPLSKEPNENGIRPLSILFKSLDAKREFETAVKESGSNVKCAVMWPKDLAPKIKQYRATIQQYTNPETGVDLTNKHILIRPTRNNREISIKYRAKDSTAEWTNFIKFQIPLRDETYKYIMVNPPKLPGELDPNNYDNGDEEPDNMELNDPESIEIIEDL